MTTRRRSAPHAQSLVCAEFARIAERFEAADRRAKATAAAIACPAAGAKVADRETAEAEQWEAVGDFWAAESDFADLLLLLLRYAVKHLPDALRLYRAEALRPELGPLAEALARMEARR